MPNEVIRELVLDQALLSEADIEVACAVRSAFDALQRKVIVKFLKELEDTLTASAGDEWSLRIEYPEELVLLGHERLLFFAGKKKWINTRPIVLATYGRNAQAYIGVQKSALVPMLTIQNEEALRLSLFNISQQRAKPEGGWFAWWYIPHRIYGEWGPANPEALKEMHFHTSDVVNYFRDLISVCADAISPVLDRPGP